MADDSNELSDENKLEITRNPFDSQLYDRENFPVLDATIFVDAATPQRGPNEQFRWSIDQIAKMKPAEMDMFPNQEYSVNYERKEDEERDQEQVNEYFKHVLLPSPWLENQDILKRVTFSPHPPATRYISNHIDSSRDVSYMSCTSSQQGSKSDERKSTSFCDETMLADACCQTTLTFPVNLDLEFLLGTNFYSYSHDSIGAKELMVSSLRRKLFGQESKADIEKNNHESPRSTPSYTTSSPSKESLSTRKRPSPGASSKSSDCTPSPCKVSSSTGTPSVFSPVDGFSPKQASNVGTPQHARKVDLSFSSVDMSPIKSCGENKDEDEEEESRYSFLPEVSFDLNETEEEVKESSRNARFDSPEFSPIKNDKFSCSMYVAALNTDSLELQEVAQQSVKESTARNIHAFTGFDISSINEVSKHKELENIQEDRGPLDISELTSIDEKGDDIISNDNSDDTDGGGCGGGGDNTGGEQDTDHPDNYDEKKPELLDITDLTTSIVDRASDSLESNPVSSDYQENPEAFISPPYTRVTPDNCSNTPLRSILKHRETITPTRTNLKGMNREESTRYNTARNRGRKIDDEEPAFTQIVCANPPSGSTLPRPVLTERSLNTNFQSNFNESPDLEFINWRKAGDVIDSMTDTTLSDDMVCIKANSALRRARKFTSTFEREFGEDAENKSPLAIERYRRQNPLNSTEITGNSMELPSSIRSVSGTTSHLTEDPTKESAQTDSGVSSMDWCSGSNNQHLNKAKAYLKSSILQSRSMSPLLQLEQLSLSCRKKTDSRTWSVKKGSSRSAVLNRSGTPSRLLINRSYTWPNKERNRAHVSSNICIPRSRVTPSYKMRRSALNFRSKNSLEPYDLVKSAYKDMLPSPLK